MKSSGAPTLFIAATVAILDAGVVEPWNWHSLREPDGWVEANVKSAPLEHDPFRWNRIML
jgi:hypothetical protein